MSRQQIQLANFPFPISLSSAFINNPHGGRFPSKDFKAYKQEAFAFFLTNKKTMHEARKLIKEWLAGNFVIYVECQLYSHRWFNKDGSIKKRDAGNLEKVLIDALAEGLDFDDSRIFDLRLIKVISDKEHVSIFIEPIKPQLDEPDLEIMSGQLN